MSEALQHLSDPLLHPSAKQAEASDPLKSVWVGASAGTGKTKVLTDRVLRLMLPRMGQGVESATAPHKVLCLTFTKTAAAEMADRIYKRLGSWAVKEDKALTKELTELLGHEPSEEIEQEARKLFARVLDTPGGLKIMTIHSFCQSVLKRFPIEAGVPPHFELMDEQGAVEYLTKCLHRIINDARENPEAPLSQSFNLLTLHLDSEAMSELMQQIMSKRSLLVEILKHHGGIEHLVSGIYKALGVEPGASIAQYAKGAEVSVIKTMIVALQAGGKTDKQNVEVLASWLEGKASFAQYQSVFLTNDGDVRKRLATAAAAKVNPDIQDIMQQEAERLLGVVEKIKAVKLAELNTALFTVAAEMVGHYEHYKQYRDRLDYDDLILKTCELLADERRVPWVLYKLDSGIDHILVDEAQDTSRHQWQIVKSLTNEFFEMHGSKEHVLRTLFVVGDEKQSIFSFQGADPQEFARMQSFFGEKVLSYQQTWEVLLNHSFRSTSSVLEMVDNVFANEHVRRGVVADVSREVVHLAARYGHAGRVELWPMVSPDDKEEPNTWQMPVEVDLGESPPNQLATRIAENIRGWLDRKEILPARNRPIEPGDIMVLVQSRGAFVELLMRALKSANVPVAGIDRISLLDEIAIVDLLALAQFALLPKDDLTLAALLKSPLIGMGEDDLYTLCYGRGERPLWLQLRDQHPKVASYLQYWISAVGRATPYEFFAEVLGTPCVADSVSGKRAFYGRLGFDIEDALDEFLNTCLHYEQSHTPSMQSFVSWFQRSSAEIKREQESGSINAVRIMTVHASKGLQAPIVFLPDTVKKLHGHNKAKVRLLWPEDPSGVPLWSSRKEFDAKPYAKWQQKEAEKQEEEYRRLLYVAMTRAEDRLYVCGYRGVRKEKEDCWYNLILQSFPTDVERIPFTTEDSPSFALRFEYDQEIPPKQEKEAKRQTTTTQALPKWAFEPVGAEPSPPRPLAPSKQGEDPAVDSPLAPDDAWKFHRGNIVHKLLELLPEIEESKRIPAMQAYLARDVLAIPSAAQARMVEEITAVLQHSEFADIFDKNSQAEVPVVGLLGANVVSGQIDRLVVTDNRVLIVDYKSNRNPPSSVEEVPDIYRKQLQSYKDVLQNIYPDHHIQCALLWTDAPLLMPLDI